MNVNVTDESNGILKTIFLLAWPVFLEQIFTTLVGYADTAMVGSMGAEATASVSIGQPLIMLLNGIMTALGVGITSLVARAAGAGDEERVRRLMRHAVLAVLVIGFPLSLASVLLHRQIPLWMGAAPEILETSADYYRIVCAGRFFMVTSMTLNAAFRGYGDTRTPLRGNMMMNLLNVILNYLLIYPSRRIRVFGLEMPMFGAGLGVRGAAIATAAGMTAAGCYALWVAFCRKGPYTIRLRGDWRPDPVLAGQILSISLPAMLERIFMSSAGIITSRTIASLGTVSVAANSLGLTAESMSFMPAFAFQTAVTTLVGQSLGAKKPELAQRFATATLLTGSAVMVFTGACLYLLAEPIIGIFTPDERVIRLASRCLRITAFMQVPQVVAWTIGGILRGAGDTKTNFYITAATNWLIRTVWCVVLVRVFHKDLVACIYVQLAEILIRFSLLFAVYRRGKWKNIPEG